MAEKWRKPMFSDLDDTSLLRAYATKPKKEGAVREIMPTSYRRVRAEVTAKPERTIKPTSYRRVK